MSEHPFFTIITSTYNAASTLPRLLDSLASQTCRDFNWIVQDGASSDSTMQIVEQYRNSLPEVLAASCKDTGIYDAWNKALTTWWSKIGEWVIFLGADDTLYNSLILEECKKNLKDISSNILFACGDAVMVNNGNSIKKFPVNIKTGITFLPYNMPFCHTSMFSRKKILITGFDSSFKIAGDHDFFCRTWKKQEQTFNLCTTISRMSALGISSTQYIKLFKEKNSIRKKYFPYIYYKTLPLYILYYIYLIISNKKSIKNIIIKNKIGNFLWHRLSNIRKCLFKQITRRW